MRDMITSFPQFFYSTKVRKNSELCKFFRHFFHLFLLLIIPDVDIVSGYGEGRPRDVEPAGAGEELVGQGMGLQECDQALELGGIAGSDVGGLANEVLRVLDAPDLSVHRLAAESAGDDDGTAYRLTGRLQQHQTAIGHVHHLLHGRLVGRVLAPVAELRQGKMFRESCVFHSSSC